MALNQHFTSSKPLYEQIQKDLIQKIETGVFEEHQRIPSENELSREYGVSRITATKALTELALGGYIYRVQGKGSFVAPAQDRPMPITGNENIKPYLVGFIIPSIGDHHSVNLIKGITNALPFPQYIVNIFRADSIEAEEYIIHYFYQNHYDGILLFPNDFEFYSDTILQMHLKQYPFVLIDRIFQKLNCSYVTSDNPGGSEIAVEYLRKRGHTKIGFAGFVAFREQVTAMRYNGYVQAMNKHGFNILPYENLFGQPPQPKLLNHLLEDITYGEVTALIASNSKCAINLVKFFRQNQIRVPEDVSIVCFDNPSLYVSPTNFFTYIDQDSYNMGIEAGKILKSLMTKEGDTSTFHQVFHPTLVENHSVRTI